MKVVYLVENCACLAVFAVLVIYDHPWLALLPLAFVNIIKVPKP